MEILIFLFRGELALKQDGNNGQKRTTVFFRSEATRTRGNVTKISIYGCL